MSDFAPVPKVAPAFTAERIVDPLAATEFVGSLAVQRVLGAIDPEWWANVMNHPTPQFIDGSSTFFPYLLEATEQVSGWYNTSPRLHSWLMECPVAESWALGVTVGAGMLQNHMGRIGSTMQKNIGVAVKTRANEISTGKFPGATEADYEEEAGIRREATRVDTITNAAVAELTKRQEAMSDPRAMAEGRELLAGFSRDQAATEYRVPDIDNLQAFFDRGSRAEWVNDITEAATKRAELLTFRKAPLQHHRDGVHRAFAIVAHRFNPGGLPPI